MRAAAPLAFASDTASIATMEVVEPAVALLVAGAVAWPLDGWLIARGRGHAVLRAHHGHAS